VAEGNGKDVVKVAPPRLPYDARIEERFNIDIGGWRALTDAIFPSASSTDAIILALSYCKARKLDPFKKPVQIVPMWDAKRKAMVDTVWPGIGELRTTAFRTGQYAGRDAAIFGEMMTAELDGVSVIFPEWCEVVVYRIMHGVRCAFHGPRVHWLETYATKGRDTKAPNAMWAKRPNGQLEKCAEAAALRAAFPEELGNEYAAEEMEGKVLDAEAMGVPETVGVPKGQNSRQAKISEVWPQFEKEVRGFVTFDPNGSTARDALSALEEWWASGETQTRIQNMPPKWQECASDEYEKVQERLYEMIAADPTEAEPEPVGG
jgi:phage recombination protein Bet